MRRKPLTEAEIEACRRIGRDEVGRASTIGLPAFSVAEEMIVLHVCHDATCTAEPPAHACHSLNCAPVVWAPCKRPQPDIPAYETTVINGVRLWRTPRSIYGIADNVIIRARPKMAQTMEELAHVVARWIKHWS